VETASEMTYTVSGGVLNSTQSNPGSVFPRGWKKMFVVCCTAHSMIDYWHHTVIHLQCCTLWLDDTYYSKSV